MSGRHVIELNIVAFCFAIALYLFLRVVNRGNRKIRLSYVQMLFTGACVALTEAQLGIMLNVGLTREIPEKISMYCFIILSVAEFAESIYCVIYIADHADDGGRTVERLRRPLLIIFLAYLVVQVINFFTGIAYTTTPNGRFGEGGPLLIPVMYGMPGAMLLFATVLYFVLLKKESFLHRITVLSAVIAPLVAAVVQVKLMPQMMIIGFSVVFSAFLIYYVFEMPPFRQLTLRMKELEEAGKIAEEARQKATEADEAMNDFLANMSHEIRTPLTAILGYDEVILKDAQEEDVREYAKDIRAAGNTLLYIVNDILDFSKMASGDMSLSVAPYRLSEVIDNLDNIIRKRARDKGLEFRTQIDAGIPDLIIGDSVRVNQILINLLNNAVKYTSHGHVGLSVSAQVNPDGESLVLKAAVEDTGTGIRKEELPGLFDAFSRFDMTKNRGVEGTGLGLAITSRLLHLMGGTIDVSSEYGKGSVFTVTIPQKIADKKTMAQREVFAANQADTDAFYAPDASLLVVDDNDTNRSVVAELLRHTLMTIDTASGGLECIARVREKAYDVILLDQMMPNMSGVETLRQMKVLNEHNLSRSARIIAFTANAIAGVREQLIGEGFDDYLSKPVTAHDLSVMMRRHLPRDKYLLPGDAGYATARSRDEEMMAPAGQKSDDQKRLEQLRGVDLSLALTHCGTKEVLLAAVRDFYLTIDQQSALIEKYEQNDDIANFTIKVHALKSAALYIGARALSEDAAHLEMCGHKKRVEEIREKTPKLLSDYRSYKTKLASIDPHAVKEKDDRPEIGKEDLEEAYEEIKAFAEAFDFDGIDAVMEELRAYRIPEAESEKYTQVADAVANVDRDSLLRLL